MNCKHCTKPLERKRFNGRLEDLSAFNRRVYCNRACMANGMEGIKVMSDKNSRRQSAKVAALVCQSCGAATNLQVHHRDENPQNNAPSNLRTLCASCHRRCHSPNYTETGERRKPCEFCSAPSIKRGWCFTHISRFKRFGHPLAKKKKTASGWVLMLHDGQKWLPFPLNKTPAPAWDDYAPTVMRSTPRRRKLGSKP